MKVHKLVKERCSEPEGGHSTLLYEPFQRSVLWKSRWGQNKFAAPQKCSPNFEGGSVK